VLSGRSFLDPLPAPDAAAFAAAEDAVYDVALSLAAHQEDSHASV
jgi:hypothetical protein